MLRLQLLGGVQLSATDGRDLRPLLGRPKRLALLAYLAAREGGSYARRDTLTALLWPEMDQTAARKAVRQALYVLRNDLGEDLFETAGDDEVRVLPEVCWCDVPAFLDAVRNGRQEEALELYRGDLMPAFFVPDGGAGFERWLEEERGRLRTLASNAAWDLAEGAERNRKSGPATTFGRQALSLTHDDEIALRRLIALLDRMGDRAGALRAYETFARRLKAEFGDEPSAETQALIARVRERSATVSSSAGAAAQTAPAAGAPPEAPAVAPDVVPIALPAPATETLGVPIAKTIVLPPVSSPAKKQWYLLAAAVGLLLLLGGGALWRTHTRRRAQLSNSPAVSMRSASVRDHYRRGLEAYYTHQDSKEAQQEMEAALAEDSTFAMAAYWLVNLVGWEDQGTGRRYMQQAARMARYATPEERRLIDLQAGITNNDPRVLPLAELLAAQNPRDTDLLVKAATAAYNYGRFDRSAQLARQALALDTTATKRVDGSCPACEAYSILTSVLIVQDSQAAAEQLLRQWRAARPDALGADRFMAVVLEYQDRFDEARAIALQMTDRRRGDVDLVYQTISSALRRGEAPAARRLLLDTLARTPNSTRDQFDWMLSGVLRNGGRPAEASRRAGQLLRGGRESFEAQLAQAAWEAGDTATATRLVRPALGRQAVPGSDGPDSPRTIAWWLTRGSTYLATAGDTASLRIVEQRLEQLAQISGFGRDQRAYHYPKALLAEARQQWPEAEAEFRAAIFAPSDGYTRINMQLAQLLISQRRAAEAVPILRNALHTDIMRGSTLYVTQAELHEAMGQAFAALNEVDSARVHYSFVVRTWSEAEPRYHERRAAAQAWLDSHRRPVP
ncbi:MAG: BTAD domain-containing putative transcriptional regulator [Gemmatimonadales bacterium]